MMGLPSFAFTKPAPAKKLVLSADERREWLEIYKAVVAGPPRHSGESSFWIHRRGSEAADYAIEALRNRGAEHANGR